MEFLLPFLVALALVALVVPVAMWGARRIGLVAQPRKDRWHRRPTPLLGGVAIYVGFVVPMLVFGTLTREMVGLLLAGGLVFLLGLIDDLRPVRPAVKLAGQVVAASVLVPFGIQAIFVIHPLVAVPATVFWIVAVTNAFNLLDNMDGLSAGVAFLSSCFTFLVSLEFGQTAVATASAILAGASLGFLIFNFYPARIFMGDSGSLFIGFSLGSLTILGTWREASSLSLVLLVPLLVLAVPLFDTTLVTMLRKFTGRAVSQGGRDHSSHRLVALGLSERHAVLVLYAVCTAFGALAVVGLWFDLFVTAIVVGLLLVLILFFGVFLAEAKVYGEGLPAWQVLRERSPILSRLLPLKWLIIEVSTDLILVSAAYLGAYLIRFEGHVPAPLLAQIQEVLPIVLPLHISALVLFGVYQQEWRYGGLRANFGVVQATVVGGIASWVGVRLLTELSFYSRGAFIIAALLVMFLIMGSRSILRVFREWSRERRAHGRRVLVVGAGDAAARVVLELRSHPELAMVPVALVDDNPSKRGRRLHGVSIVGDCTNLAATVARLGAQEVIFAIPSLGGSRRRQLLDACARSGVPYQVALGSRQVPAARVGKGVRPPGLSDLLARARWKVDTPRLRAAFEERSVLIIGLGSTAVPELARCAGGLGLSRVILGSSDSSTLAHQLEELARSDADGRFEGRVLHLGDEGSLARVLRETRPDAVFFAASLRSERLAELDPAGALETNFLSVAAAARQSTAAGVRAFVLWSVDPSGDSLGVSLRLGELAAAALGPPRVAALRFPAVAEDPENLLGQILEAAAHGAPLARFPPERRVRLALASEVAAASLEAAASGPGSEVVRLAVPDEPLAELADLVLRHLGYGGATPAPRSGPGAETASEGPTGENGGGVRLVRAPLPRPGGDKVEEVEGQVREALRGGRLEDALAAASLLVPGRAGNTGGEMFALDAQRRRK